MTPEDLARRIPIDPAPPRAPPSLLALVIYGALCAGLGILVGRWG